MAFADGPVRRPLEVLHRLDEGEDQTSVVIEGRKAAVQIDQADFDASIDQRKALLPG